jgi:hypothetical protein
LLLRLAVATLPWAAGLWTTSSLLAAEPADPAATAAAIDERIEGRLAAENIPLSPPADDAEFLRRATLDIAGRIPTYEEATAFLLDEAADKRSRAIERLLADPGYGEHQAAIWHELIVPRGEAKSAKSVRDPFAPWLAEQFNRGRGWDAIVTDLLTASGKIRDNPETHFILANSDSFEPKANLLADATARLFWGVQLRCAECHDHPFASWKQTDFWSTAAFFSRLRKGYLDGKNPVGFTFTEAPPDEEQSQKFAESQPTPDAEGPAIVVPETGGKLASETVQARFLGLEEPAWTDEGPYRERFAEWATSAEHPYFAANAVNRLWAQFMGRGLVQPLDGLGPENAASHPEVLDLLARELAAADFDLKHVVRIICSTRAYQRTSRPADGNETDSELYSHMAVKPLRPEMLYDSLSVALFPVPPKSSSPKGGSKPSAAKPSAATPQPAPRPQPLPDISRSEFVVMFGTRPDENDGSIVNSGVPQFLRLLNGKLLNEETPSLSRVLKSDLTTSEAIESLYLTALSRLSTDSEMKLMKEFVADAGDDREAYAGILWALVNSAEFVLNH